MSTPAYKRAPSEESRILLSPGGFLGSIVQVANQRVSGHHHDVHFRRGDEVDVYRGQTTLVKIKVTGNGEVDLRGTHHTYKSQPSGQVFLRSWRIDEPGFGEGLHRYLNDVQVNPRHTKGEGLVQEHWSQVKDCWVPFDREAVLEGHRPVCPKILAAFNNLTDLAKLKRWEPPNATGTKLDQLAVDEEGQLVLLELKDGTKSNAKVYYSPFQLLQYIWEWHIALEDVRTDLQAVIDARAKVGLTPINVPKLTGGIRPAVGFGVVTPRGNTQLNYERVLDIVNEHLPRGVKPIETWAITTTGPVKLAT